VEELGRKAVALRFDSSKVSTFDAFVREVGAALQGTWGRDRFDVLINNAGTSAHASFATTQESDFDHLVNIHFKGVFFLTQKLLPFIRDEGRIVNISSGLARFALPGYSAYGSMKGAVEVLTRYLAKELGPRGIRVNTVAPGAIETDFSGGAVRDNPELNKFVASVTALGRAGVPDDIGPMIASLVGEDNRWITGQRIEVSGGMFL
jgi:NAD(P)-dependent dehydrogenase (short-subunit alcohol dehydrogenase family)